MSQVVAPRVEREAELTKRQYAPLVGLDSGDTPPAIRALDELHDAAVRARASDIHLEPCEGGGRVRQRVDGMLLEARQMPSELFAQVISRIKLLASLDIAEKRQPQDGRYHIESHGRSIDARVSSIPTIFGEKLVVRLLDLHANIPSLEHLGMAHEVLARFRSLLHAPHGFLVVCGPTGSGKTTTLYGSLNERNVEGQNLCTVEDPVEVRMPGVSQIQVHERAGLTFASALRALLRQDPNVIMVGEMRDSETANVAVSAALSGQLVLTTLHASDAPRAVDRLVELGLKRHALAAALSAVVSQRLIRTLCEHCCRPVPIGRADANDFGLPIGAVACEATGCAECAYIGYRGRTAIFELLTVTDEVREAIAASASSVAISGFGARTGYQSMVVQGLERVLRGQTSTDELRRVLALVR